MSAADVEIGGPSAPRWGVTLVARLRAFATRLRAGVARLLDPDDSALAAWAAAFAKAPQAVPDLPLPPNRRLARFVLGFVIGAHVALLATLYWRSSPPPPPQSEMTVELVREMPEAAKPPETKPETKPPQVPVREGKSAEHKETTQQQTKQEQQSKAEQHQAAREPKAEARQPKPAHQRQAHRAAPPKEQPKAQDDQKAREQEKARDEQKAEEQQKHEREEQEQQRPAPGTSQAQRDTPPAMAAVALPGASDAGTEAVSYQQLVLSQVAKAKKQGRYMGVPGYAGVRFRVAEDGSLEMVKLVVSSGDPNLDIEAEAMIRRAAPFPKPPPDGRRDYGITLVFAAQPAP